MTHNIRKLSEATEPLLVENKVWRAFTPHFPSVTLQWLDFGLTPLQFPFPSYVEPFCAIPHPTCRRLGHVQEGRGLLLDC